MKKSTKVQLVLISVALASCNRLVVPQPTAMNSQTDMFDPGVDSNHTDSCCNEYYSELWNFSLEPQQQFPDLPSKYSLHYLAGNYRERSFWKKNTIIVRGGWGNCGVTTTGS